MIIIFFLGVFIGSFSVLLAWYSESNSKVYRRITPTYHRNIINDCSPKPELIIKDGKLVGVVSIKQTPQHSK